MLYIIYSLYRIIIIYKEQFITENKKYYSPGQDVKRYPWCATR